MTKKIVAPVALRDLEHLVLERLARHRVERAERLVHHQRGGLLRETSRDLQSLLHAARHLRRVLVGEGGEADALQQPGDAVGALGPSRSHGLERQRHVSGGGAPRQQRLGIILEHDRHITARAPDRGAGESDVAARRPDESDATRRAVVLPQPDGPTTQTISPRRTVNDNLPSTRCSPKATSTSRNAISGGSEPFTSSGPLSRDRPAPASSRYGPRPAPGRARSPARSPPPRGFRGS